MARRLYLAVDVHDPELNSRDITSALHGVFSSLADGPQVDRRAQLVAASWDRISAAVVSGDPSRYDPETRPAPFHTLDVQVVEIEASGYNANRAQVTASSIDRDGNGAPRPALGDDVVRWWHPLDALAPPPFGTRLTVEIHPYREDT
jgi:hypothetical protein